MSGLSTKSRTYLKADIFRVVLGLALGLCSISPTLLVHADTTEASHNSNTTGRELSNEEAQTKMLSWKPEKTIPLVVLKILAEEARKEADKGKHDYCLFDTSDRCFYRNARIKLDLAAKMKKLKFPFDADQVTATAFIKGIGDNEKWSYHTVAVIYTDEGPYVFDPDNKDPEKIYTKGDLLTPLKDWLKVKWKFNESVTMLAPPGYIFADDFDGRGSGAMSKEDVRAWWRKLRGATPDDPYFKAHPINVSFDKAWLKKYDFSGGIKASSEKNYENLRDGGNGSG